MIASIEFQKKIGRQTRNLLALGLTSMAVLAACGSSSGSTSGTSPAAGTRPAGVTAAASSSAALTPVNGKINLVAYSTPQAAYQAIEQAFKATPQGKDVSFTESYGASGDQSRAVAAGQPADVVAFSLEPDITRLVKANMVAADWNKDGYKGMVTD
jgi:ABC-type sulfate transport system substrate-binding protein